MLTKGLSNTMGYSELANWNGSANDSQKSILSQYSRVHGNCSKIQGYSSDQKSGGRAIRHENFNGDSRESSQLVKRAVSDAIAGRTENQCEEMAVVDRIEVHDQTQDASTGHQSRLSVAMERERSYGSEQSSIPNTNNNNMPSTTPKAYHILKQLGETSSTSGRINQLLPRQAQNKSLASTHSVHDEDQLETFSDPNDSAGVVDDMLMVRDDSPPPDSANSAPSNYDSLYACKRNKVTYAGRRSNAQTSSKELSPGLSLRVALSKIMKRREQSSKKGKDVQKLKSRSKSPPISPGKLDFDCVLIPLKPTREIPRTSQKTYISPGKKDHVQEGKKTGLGSKQEPMKDEGKIIRGSDRANNEVIYITSSPPSSIPATTPGTATPARTTYDDLDDDSIDFTYPHEEGIEDGDQGRDSQQPIIIDLVSDSDEQYKPSGVQVAAVPKSTRSRTITSMKRIGKRAAEGVKAEPENKSKRAPKTIVIPESSSEREDDAQISTPRCPLRLRPSSSLQMLSSTLSLAPPTSPARLIQQTRESSEPMTEDTSQPPLGEDADQPEGATSKRLSQSDDVEETAKMILNLIMKPSVEDYSSTQAASAQCESQRHPLGPAAENETTSLLEKHSFLDVHDSPSLPPPQPINHPRQSSPGPSSHFPAKSVQSGDGEHKMVKRGTNRSFKRGKLKNFKEDEDSDETMQVQSDDSIEDDVYCHSCKNKNVYAKMKCTFPYIVFDAFSVTFICPRCAGTCICGSCCKRRGVPTPVNKRVSWKSLGVLLLSEQATQRQQRYGTSSSRRRKDDDWVSPSRRRAAYKTNIDVGERWIHAQNRARVKAGKPPGRAFVGAWQDAWGPSPAALCIMDGVDLDVHTTDSKGAGKAKVLDPSKRFYLGDVQGLRRPFLLVDDLQLPASQLRLRKPSSRARKLSAGNSNHEEQSRKKRLRIEKPQIDVSEFAINHQESETPSEMSSMHLPTPDDFTIPEPGLQMSPLQITPLRSTSHTPHNDMVGMSHYDHAESFGNDDAYTFDWERMQAVDEMKPYAYTPYDDPSLSQQELYDSYAAALGAAANADPNDPNDPNVAFAYGYTSPAPILSSVPNMYDEDIRAGFSLTHKNTTGLTLDAIDPVLLAQDASVPINSHHYSGASSAGLSQEDLERAVRMALAALGLSEDNWGPSF
ncbi:hypothetical protein EW145_g1974 [Phellinidium pouzarii]|uniref:Zinc-finger domain-containing protein n=1 Tax=Phellinidium pouzarii TaxID=167371 RepID=A0A4S4LCI8_9AGAM|nr:hypothetical protein EW145_g1974 [Phellinidium pouzarii]